MSLVSQARSGEGSALAVTLRPRHPLFGGWRTAFTLGYRLPAPTRSRDDVMQVSVKIRTISYPPNFKLPQWGELLLLNEKGV
jgi:hypothetical protein